MKEEVFFTEGPELFAPERSELEKRMLADMLGSNKTVNVSGLLKVLSNIVQGNYK